MFFKNLPRRKRNHTMLIGDAVKLYVSALARDDVACPNEIEISFDASAMPAGAGIIRVRIENLHGNQPKVVIDAAREVRITHESCGELPDAD
jgi:sRNA-binding carbon storage regulator CsrA